jgi:hypothetical protein
LTERRAAANFESLPVTCAHGQRAHDIGHPDPFDSLLIAQADVEPLNFLTVEEKLAEFSRMVVMVSRSGPPWWPLHAFDDRLYMPAIETKKHIIVKAGLNPL